MQAKWNSFKTTGNDSTPSTRSVAPRASLKPTHGDVTSRQVLDGGEVMSGLIDKWLSEVGSPIIIYTKKRPPVGTNVIPPVVIIQEGSCRVNSTGLSGWKERDYKVYSNGYIRLYEHTPPAASSPGSPTVLEKSAIQIDQVMVVLGDLSHIDTSGSSDFSLEHGIPLDLLTFTTIIDYDQAIDTYTMNDIKQLSDKNKVQLVFDSSKMAKVFLEAVTKASIRNNIRVRFSCFYFLMHYCELL